MFILLLMNNSVHYCFSYQKRKHEGKIPYVKSDELSERERKNLRNKWKAASRVYRERRKMEKAMLDLTPQSIENTLPDPAGVEGVDGEQESPGGCVVVDAPPQNEDFHPQMSSTPERKDREKKAEKRCKRLQAENHELRKLNINLRKQLAKIRKEKERARKGETRAKERLSHSERLKPKGGKKLAKERKLAVVSFLTRDENSRLLPGKKDTITKNKIKEQRRILTKPLTELHGLYNSEMKKSLHLSYRQFARRRPFYVTEPKAKDRDTCACMDHENVHLLANKLYGRGLLKTKSISELLVMIVCDPKNKDCMDRVCAKCCFDEVEFPETESSSEVTWDQWKRVTSTNGKRMFGNMVKQIYTGTIKDLMELFSQKLESLAIHQFNWLHQAEQFRYLKQNITGCEAVLHVDFSENYACKLNTEVQAFHFGGSRQQATIHTAVLYTVHGTKSYATLSDSLRHDERAVWAHLEPILGELRETFPQITTLHIQSDGPVTQYRNKNNFYLLSTVPFLSGFTKVTWNYSEKSHGKGAPDGIGGAIKREADRFVQRGGELQTPQQLYEMLNTRLGSSITHYWVNRESIEKCDELIPDNLEAVKGTFKIHQVWSTQPSQITHRTVSCFCRKAERSPCPCYKPVTVDLRVRRTVCNTENPPSSPPQPPREQENLDLCGKFVIVIYDEKPYVGQVLEVVGEEVQVNCMLQSGDKNLFVWPQTVDLIFYYRKDVHAVISEPEPATSRFSKLTLQDWVKFRNTSA